MVKLQNIKKSSDNIECDILPENSIEHGHVSVDLDTEEVIQYSLPNGFEWCIIHVEHVRKAMLELCKQKELPKEKIVMWY